MAKEAQRKLANKLRQPRDLLYKTGTVTALLSQLIYKHKNFRKIEFEFFSNSAFSRNFWDFLDKCCHISVVVKYFSKISTVINSWDVKIKVRVPFSKKIHKRALSEMFEN